MAWTPDERSLAEIHQTLVESTDTANREVQKTITLKLNSFTRVPDYIAYLSYILLSHPPAVIDERIRSIAGYLLKNNARLITKCEEAQREYVKAAVLKAFEMGGSMIRNAAGQDIVAIMGAVEPRNWGDALSVLVNMIDTGASIEIQEVRSFLQFLQAFY
jgi:transportin-1